MNRLMYDGLGVDSAKIAAVSRKPDLIAVYDTGTPSVIWTPEDRSLFPGIPQVTIDQGYISPVITKSMVRDVEPRAWNPASAVKTGNWDTPRPTIYCDRNDLANVIALGWHGDVWLAFPGYTAPTPPILGPVNIVAVQNTNGAIPETSIVYDTTWPLPAMRGQEMYTSYVTKDQPAFIPFAPGAYIRLRIYRDFITSSEPVKVRVAVHSEARGYSVTHLTLSEPSPYTLLLHEADTDAISIAYESGPEPAGFTLS